MSNGEKQTMLNDFRDTIQGLRNRLKTANEQRLSRNLELDSPEPPPDPPDPKDCGVIYVESQKLVAMINQPDLRLNWYQRVDGVLEQFHEIGKLYIEKSTFHDTV